MSKLFVGLLTLMIMLLNQVTCMVYAYKPSQFPGKGDYSAWTRAQKLYKDAVALCKSGHYQEGIQESEEAIAIYPYDGSFWQCIGIACYHIKQLKRAEDALRKSIALNPDDYASWNALANALDDQNKLEEERDAYLQALACKYPPPEDMRTEILTAIKSIDHDLLARKK